MKLLEQLVVMAVIWLLVAMLLGTVSKSLRYAKEWVYGAYGHKENQAEAFLDDSSSENRMLFWTTNRPVRWTFVDSRALASP